MLQREIEQSVCGVFPLKLMTFIPKEFGQNIHLDSKWSRVVWR
jgi:hypothetical protein